MAANKPDEELFPPKHPTDVNDNGSSNDDHNKQVVVWKPVALNDDQVDSSENPSNELSHNGIDNDLSEPFH